MTHVLEFLKGLGWLPKSHYEAFQVYKAIYRAKGLTVNFHAYRDPVSQKGVALRKRPRKQWLPKHRLLIDYVTIVRPNPTLEEQNRILRGFPS